MNLFGNILTKIGNNKDEALDPMTHEDLRYDAETFIETYKEIFNNLRDPDLWIKISLKPSGIVLDLFTQEGTPCQKPEALMNLLKGATTQEGQIAAKGFKKNYGSIFIKIDKSCGITALKSENKKAEESITYHAWGASKTGFFKQYGQDKEQILALSQFHNHDLLYQPIGMIGMNMIADYGEKIKNLKCLKAGANMVRRYENFTILVNESTGFLGYCIN